MAGKWFWREISRFFVVAGKFYYDQKKKVPVFCLAGCAIVSVFGSGDYARKKKSSSRLSGGLCCCIVSVFGSGGKLAVFLLWLESFIMTGKKKDTVVCLVGARSLLRPEKKIQSSVWRVRDHVCLSCRDRYICIIST